jgi:hypothetical protein
MRMRNILLSLLLAGSAGIATTACTTRAYLVEEAPPAPREEVAVSRPGQVWVAGHWAREGSRWAWQPGHYVRERPGHIYVTGRWDHRPQGYVWIEGGWRARGGVVVRGR